MKIRQVVPWSLVFVRVLGCPLIIVGAKVGWAGCWLSIIVIAALLSDIYDGALARRWGSETVRLRSADSLADTVFYVGVVAALWMRESQVIRDHWHLFAVLFSLEGGRYVFDIIKFHKAASYHSYLAKGWGLLVAIAVVGAFSVSRLTWLIPVAVMLGIVVNLEGIAMSLILPKWKNDVKTLGRAWMLRKEIEGQSVLAGTDTM